MSFTSGSTPASVDAPRSGRRHPEGAMVEIGLVADLKTEDAARREGGSGDRTPASASSAGTGIRSHLSTPRFAGLPDDRPHPQRQATAGTARDSNRRSVSRIAMDCRSASPRSTPSRAAGPPASALRSRPHPCSASSGPQARSRARRSAVGASTSRRVGRWREQRPSRGSAIASSFRSRRKRPADHASRLPPPVDDRFHDPACRMNPDDRRRSASSGCQTSSIGFALRPHMGWGASSGRVGWWRWSSVVGGAFRGSRGGTGRGRWASSAVQPHMRGLVPRDR